MTAAVGADRIERRDHRVSPVRYAGVTAGLQGVGLERLTNSTLLQARIEFAEGDLTSMVSGGREHLQRATVEGSVQLRARRSLLVGVEMGLRAEAVEHVYPATTITEEFDVTVASLSPVVTWLPLWRGRPFRVKASVAALSLVDREYSRTKAGSASDRISGPATWTSGAIELSRDFRENARVSWRVSAGASAWSHRREEGAASVETRASVIGRVRMGTIR